MEPSDHSKRPTPTVETAAEWFVRIRDEQLNESTRREYVRWLRASPQNVAEMLRVWRLYGQLRWSKLHAELSGDNVLSSIVDRYPPPGAPLARNLRASLRPRRLAWIAVLLVIALLLIVALSQVFQQWML